MRRAMICDALSDAGDASRSLHAAIRSGSLELLNTHVQEGQLADIGDPVRRQRLQRLPRTVVPFGAPVLDVARTGRPVPSRARRPTRSATGAGTRPTR